MLGRVSILLNEVNNSTPHIYKKYSIPDVAVRKTLLAKHSTATMDGTRSRNQATTERHAAFSSRRVLLARDRATVKRELGKRAVIVHSSGPS